LAPHTDGDVRPVAEVFAIHICGADRHGDDAGDGVDVMMNEVILPLIGIVLISLILAVAYG